MNEYLLYFGIGVGILFLALMIPGLSIIAEGIIKTFFEVLLGLFKHKGMFMIWAVKTLIDDHVRVIQHAVTPRDVLDPTQKVRKQAS